MKKFIAPALATLGLSVATSAQTTIVPFGATWKYLDNGSNQGTAWRGIGFADLTWPSGGAELGYGDGDETTVVSFGSTSKKKYITTYFRKSISVSNPAAFSELLLQVKRDDGVIVYINGTEVYRNNMPTGTVSFTTTASTNVRDDGTAVLEANLAATLLVAGNNVIAAEIHQRSSNDADISFDLALTGILNSNNPPIAYAGNDQNITLPQNSTTLSGSASTDSDGTITAYSWSFVSGPSSPTISTPNNANTTVSALVAGTYIFQLTVTDNDGASNTDAVTVVVSNSALVSYFPITFGSSWKYLDNGTDQGTNWRQASFNDGAWAMGNAELGYGDGDETTVVSFGPSSSAKYITTYFRKTVNIPNGASFASYSLELRRDDGAVVYVNGAEVFRTNMPTGTITYLTGASGATSDDGNSIFTASLPASFFASGNNVIAVEIHQNNGSSSDISFDLQLKANAPGMPIITRGPYLQMGNGNSVSIRWRTDVATTTGAWYGSTPGSIANAFTDNTSTTEHEIRLTGMNPDTKYYYSIGTATQQVEGDANNFFTTAPASNTTRKLRIAAFGDCGRNDNNFQSGSLSAYRNYVGESPAEIMLLLGDNAYSNGTDTEYQSNFFNVYSGNILKNHVLFPAPGNHDYAQSSARQADKNIPYYSMFTVPATAECGGVA